MEERHGDEGWDEWNVYDDEPYPTLLGTVSRYGPRDWDAYSGTGAPLGSFKTKREAVDAVLRVKP